MRGIRVQAAVVTAGFVLLLAGAPADAFERMRDEDSGVCTWWNQRTVEVGLNDRGVPYLPLADVAASVELSLEAWNHHPCTDFRFVYSGLSPQVFIGYDAVHPDDNQNLVLYVGANWQRTARHETSALALTTVTFDACTGIIVDADVELNGEFFDFTTEVSPATEHDLQNTLTHEAGHILGLDHCLDPEATMYLHADRQEIEKRDLAQDDIDGLCHLYPAGEPVPECEGEHPPAVCQPDCGCTSGSSPVSCLGFLVLGAALHLARARRDCRRFRRSSIRTWHPGC